jgi:hypothetical protein
MRSGGRVVEGARLESEYTPKAYRGFESLPLRHLSLKNMIFLLVKSTIPIMAPRKEARWSGIRLGRHRSPQANPALQLASRVIRDFDCGNRLFLLDSLKLLTPDFRIFRNPPLRRAEQTLSRQRSKASLRLRHCADHSA